MTFKHIDNELPPVNPHDTEWSERVLVWLITKDSFRSGFYNFRIKKWTLENCSCTENPVWWMKVEKPNII
jgi:hypothetical protein